MVLKCLVVRCITNYDCYDRGAVFSVSPVTREPENLHPNVIFQTIKTPGKPPGQKIFQEDQMKTLIKSDVIKCLDDINKEKMKSLDA